MAIAICKQCNKKFNESRCSKNIFCSLSCYHKSMVGVSHNHNTSHTAWNKGLKLPNQSGKNHHRYIEDRTQIVGKHDRRFHDPEYKQWHRCVKNRDGWKCKISNSDCSGRVEAHHILGWKDYPELRYEVNNGITLCHFHHPRKRKDEMRLSPYFMDLIKV